MVFKQIILFLLLIFTIYFSWRVIYRLLVFVFKKNDSALYVSSFDRHLRLMEKHLSLDVGKRLVDLGCGDGKAMRFFVKHFGLLCDGYELQKFPYYYGRLCNLLLGFPQITLYHQDFSQAQLEMYDYVYVYLLPQQMAQIESWIFDHVSENTIVISNSFPFVLHTPYKTVKDTNGKNRIFLYHK